uniref:Uncharacterized protein n=1 Tax=Arundo donax TaxID=35708 RepID=A0A0A8ZA45_ARUDO
MILVSITGDPLSVSAYKSFSTLELSLLS